MISVVIPTNNRSNLLIRAVESVEAQTYKDVEIIVVSDGSTDDTDIKIGELQERYPNIVYISYNQAQGANHARNLGIERATGEYVAFLDDDDEWLPEKLEKQISCFERGGQIGLVYTGVKVIYFDEKKTYMFIPRKRGDLRKDILIENIIGTTSTVMVKREIFETVGGFDEEMPAMQDYDLWIRICQVTQIGVVSEALINYYNYSNNNQISGKTSKYEEAIKKIEKKYSGLYKLLDDKENNAYMYSKYIGLAQRNLRNGSGKFARKYIKIALHKQVTIRAIATYILSFFPYRVALFFRRLKK